jgi:hypothetical protein
MATPFSAVAAMQALERASDGVKRQATGEAERAAYRLVGVLQTFYPVRDGRIKTGFPPGELRRRVGVQAVPGIGYRVRSYAPHVHFYEGGTRERFDSTRQNARRGRAPAHNVFIPNAVRERASYLRRLQSVLDGRIEIGSRYQ